MEYKAAIKKNNASIQVLNLLSILLQGNFSMNELIEKLNALNEKKSSNNSVVSKYINTCRYCGIDIKKFQNKYSIAKLPFGVRLNSTDIGLLDLLRENANTKMTSADVRIFQQLWEKLNMYSDKKIISLNNKDQGFIDVFSEAISEKRCVKLVLKNKSNFECIPLRFTEHKGKNFYHVMTLDKKELMVSQEKISGIVIISRQFTQQFVEQSVLFELRGELAQKYSLRENENIINRNIDGSIVVANRGEVKEILLSRLLRYDNKCEIISPKSYRYEMMQILDDALSNYGEKV